MEKQNVKKVMTLSFLGAAILAYVVVNIVFRALAADLALVARLYDKDWVSNGLPLIVAVIVFSVMQFSPKIVAWAEDVVIEVSKVVWPTGRDTFVLTVVVCVFCVISAALLMGIDFIAKNLVQFIIQ